MAVGIEERRVLIVGLGLIGGSLAAALRSAGFGAAKEGAIHACDPDPDEIRRGIEMGLIDRGDTRLAEVVEGASMIVLAAAFRQVIFVEVAIVYALLSFVGTLFIAKYLGGEL